MINTCTTRLVVGHHYAHHSDSSGYDRLSNYLSAPYLDLTPLVVGKRYRGVPLGPFRRSFTNAVLHRKALRADLVHLLYPEFHLSGMMRLYRGKIVATVHHPFAWHFGTLGGVKGSWRRQHLLRQIQRGFCHVDGVIVLTPAEVPLYKTQLPHALVRFIPHGVKDYRRFATKGSKEPGQLRICVVGQTYRDIDMVESLVRRAVAEKKQWLFHLIGFRSPISEALVSSGLVRMEPRLDEPEYLSLLGSCDINLLPLTHATANNALLEAHSVGTPTLISDLSEVEAYRLPSTQGFGDAEEAWQILVRAEEDRPWLAGLREMTRDESPRFHWQHIAASVEQLYADVMA